MTYSPKAVTCVRRPGCTCASSYSCCECVENWEQKEMIACKQKYGMDEDDLLTTGVMSTKVSKKKIKAIAEKYLFGF